VEEYLATDKQDYLDKLNAFKYALQQEISRQGIPCNVIIEVSYSPRCKFLHNVIIQTQNRIEQYEIWVTHKGEVNYSRI